MTYLIITDIRKSHSDNGLDLITAIILNRVDYDPSRLSLAEKKCDGLLVLECGTAEMERCLQLACGKEIYSFACGQNLTMNWLQGKRYDFEMQRESP